MMTYISMKMGIVYLTMNMLASAFRQFTPDPRLNGYKCVDSNQLFVLRRTSVLSCAYSCGLLEWCYSFMFKDDGGQCYGCDGIFRNTGALQSETNTTYFFENTGVAFRFGNDSTKAAEGRVEMRYHGEWGTICKDDWEPFTSNNIAVICSSLGFYGGGEMLPKGSYQLENSSSTPLWLGGLWCDGTEQNIEQCYREEFGQANCGHDEDVAVKCFQ